MDKVQAFLKRKVAGVQVIWIILVLAVVAVIAAIRLPRAAPEPVEAEAEADVFDGDLPDTSQPVFSATPTIVQPTGTGVMGTAQPDSDDLWKRRTIDWLRQNGYSVDVATTTINKYLDGEPLTDAEKVARDRAVQVFGLPPEGIPSVLIPNPSATAPASAQGVPPTTHTVKGTSDDTFAELAKLYYGFSSAQSGALGLLRAQNPSAREPFVPGTTIRVPKYTEPKYFTATSGYMSATKIASKNGTTAQVVIMLNPAKSFPVAPGTRVRVR